MSVSDTSIILVRRTHKVFIVFPAPHAIWKFTPGKMIIRGMAICPSPQIVTSAVGKLYGSKLYSDCLTYSERIIAKTVIRCMKNYLRPTYARLAHN
jgi:hypothetical protein